MLRARANGETFVSATMCPRLPGPVKRNAPISQPISSETKTNNRDLLARVLRSRAAAGLSQLFVICQIDSLGFGFTTFSLNPLYM